MIFHERSIPAGEYFQPKPHVHLDPDGQLLILLSNWGSAELSKTITEMVIQKLSYPVPESSTEQESFDPDMTRVRKEVTETVAPVNRPPKEQILMHQKMVQAIRECNKDLLSGENQTEWKSALEITVISFDRKNIFWARCGRTQVFQRTENGIEPILYTAQSNYVLPMECLGLEENPEIHSGFLPRMKGQDLLLLSGARAPADLFQSQQLEIQAVVDVLSKGNLQHPVWVGILSQNHSG